MLYDPRKRRFQESTALTSRPIQKLLPKMLEEIGKNFSDRPDLILSAWPQVIGPQLSQMTQVVSFREGVLNVKVNNSTLYSLLEQKDKPRILKNLRDKFPGIVIKTIQFRLG